MAQDAKLNIEGKSWRVLHCSWTMNQDFNQSTGKIQSKVKGGQLNVIVPSGENVDLGNFVWQYMIDPYKKCSGSLEFSKSDEDAKFKELKFTDAYMIEMTESYDDGGGMNQRFLLTCKELSMDGATFKNEWEK
ncbi:MAG: type VI secretion system tube protein TssD [Saprospiraceae bacterium]